MKIAKPVRDQTFAVTCTAEEKKEIFRKAQESGRTVSGYIRWLMMNYPESEKKQEAEQNGEL